MSKDHQVPDNSSRRLHVTVEPAPGTIVVDTGDPFSATIKVPVIQVPVTPWRDDKPPTQTPPATTPANNAFTPPTLPVAPAPDTLDVGPPLPNDVAVLHAMIRELLETIKKSSREQEALRERLDLLLRKLYGPKAERFDPNQPWLIPEMALGQDAASDSAEEKATDDPNPTPGKSQTKGHGRKPLPKDLPRKRIEHTLTEAERICPCCGIVCNKFDEAISEQLDYKPASLFVCQHVRFKYACQNCHDHIAVANAPIAVIDKGLPGPGLLAQIAASKYADHLPLHRLERILGRHGITLSRSTMCDWMAHVADLLQPVVGLMAKIVLNSKAIHTDATKMPYLDPEVPGKARSGQMWAFVGDRDHPFNIFAFCPNHTAAGIDDFIKANHYRGYLNADALNIYDHLFADGSIIEVGCWAHCRRNFYDAKDSDPARAHVVLARIRQLYAVEKKAKELIAEQQLFGLDADALRRKLRQEQSVLETTSLHQWLVTEQAKVLPKSLIGQAIAYALRHWQALIRFLDDGFLAIDNNIAELTLRHIAIGRKNWLFAGSAKGARTAATLFTVNSSCHRHGVDVFAYLRDILERLAHDPQPSPEQLRDWLPDRWKPPVEPDSS
jgi:transposase